MVTKSFHSSKTRSFSYRQFMVRASFGVLLVGALLLLLVSNIRVGLKKVELERRREELAVKQEELERQRKELEAGVLQTQSIEYQEKILREKGLYKKPEEEVITIVRPEEEQKEKEENDSKKIWWNPFTW